MNNDFIQCIYSHFHEKRSLYSDGHSIEIKKYNVCTVCVQENNHRASWECRHVEPCYEYYQMTACGNPEAGHTHRRKFIAL